MKLYYIQYTIYNKQFHLFVQVRSAVFFWALSKHFQEKMAQHSLKNWPVAYVIVTQNVRKQWDYSSLIKYAHDAISLLY